MTIAKGTGWGHTVDRPSDLRIVRSDRELAVALTDGTGRPTGVEGGDLHRTIGSRPWDDRSMVWELPLDLLRVQIDGEEMTAVAHVVARSPKWKGSCWRGPVLAVMNAEFIGPFDVAPRGHPNDGRAEAIWCDPDLGIRERAKVRARLPAGGHLPHPKLHTRSIRERRFSFDAALEIVVDGVQIGQARELVVGVDADAARLIA